MHPQVGKGENGDLYTNSATAVMTNRRAQTTLDGRRRKKKRERISWSK
jgi:hypothetical protein